MAGIPDDDEALALAAETFRSPFRHPQKMQSPNWDEIVRPDVTTADIKREADRPPNPLHSFFQWAGQKLQPWKADETPGKYSLPMSLARHTYNFALGVPEAIAHSGEQYSNAMGHAVRGGQPGGGFAGTGIDEASVLVPPQTAAFAMPGFGRMVARGEATPVSTFDRLKARWQGPATAGDEGILGQARFESHGLLPAPGEANPWAKQSPFALHRQNIKGPGEFTEPFDSHLALNPELAPKPVNEGNIGTVRLNAEGGDAKLAGMAGRRTEPLPLSASVAEWLRQATGQEPTLKIARGPKETDYVRLPLTEADMAYGKANGVQATKVRIPSDAHPHWPEPGVIDVTPTRAGRTDDGALSRLNQGGQPYSDLSELEASLKWATSSAPGTQNWLVRPDQAPRWARYPQPEAPPRPVEGADFHPDQLKLLGKGGDERAALLAQAREELHRMSPESGQNWREYNSTHRPFEVNGDINRAHPMSLSREFDPYFQAVREDRLGQLEPPTSAYRRSPTGIMEWLDKNKLNAKSGDSWVAALSNPSMRMNIRRALDATKDLRDPEGAFRNVMQQSYGVSIPNRQMGEMAVRDVKAGTGPGGYNRAGAMTYRKPESHTWPDSKKKWNLQRLGELVEIKRNWDQANGPTSFPKFYNEAIKTHPEYGSLSEPHARDIFHKQLNEKFADVSDTMRKVRAQKRADEGWDVERFRQLDDIVSKGGTIKDAARQMGLSYGKAWRSYNQYMPAYLKTIGADKLPPPAPPRVPSQMAHQDVQPQPHASSAVAKAEKASQERLMQAELAKRQGKPFWDEHGKALAEQEDVKAVRRLFGNKPPDEDPTLYAKGKSPVYIPMQKSAEGINKQAGESFWGQQAMKEALLRHYNAVQASGTGGAPEIARRMREEMGAHPYFGDKSSWTVQAIEYALDKHALPRLEHSGYWWKGGPERELFHQHYDELMRQNALAEANGLPHRHTTKDLSDLMSQSLGRDVPKRRVESHMTENGIPPLVAPGGSSMKGRVDDGIVSAATRVQREGLPVGQIAKEAGVGRATLYRYLKERGWAPNGKLGRPFGKKEGS